MAPPADAALSTSRPEGSEADARQSTGLPQRRGAVLATLRLGGVGLAALVLAFHAHPVALAINVFWLVLLLAIALLGGLAWDRPRTVIIAGEAIVAIVAVQGLWSVAVPSAGLPPARLGETYGVSWRLAFTSPQQALMKTLPLPNGWPGQTVYLLIDLGTDYKGTAGFALTVNGHALGEINAMTVDPDVSPRNIPSWAVRLPADVIASAPLARVELRPSGLDSKLSVAGHGDPLVEPLGSRNSAFFDGVTWRHDRLAGPGGGPATGTYRIWLDVIIPAAA